MSGHEPPATDLAGTAPPTTALDDENSAWIHARGEDLNHLVTVERLRHERPELVRAVHEVAAQDGVKASILRFLAFDGESATFGYDEIEAVVDVARRTVRYHVDALDERDLLHRTSLGPSTAVEWADEAAYLVANNVLALYER